MEVPNKITINFSSNAGPNAAPQPNGDGTSQSECDEICKIIKNQHRERPHLGKKIAAVNLFRKADANRDLVLNETEVKRSHSTLLKKAYKLQKMYAAGEYDADPDMKLWEYMQAIGLQSFWPPGSHILTKEIKEFHTYRPAPLKGSFLKHLFFERRILQDIKKQILERVKNEPEWAANPLLKEDRAFALKVVKRNGLALKYADNILKKDREIVLEAIKENEGAFEYADPSLRSDPQIQQALFENNFNFYRCMNDPSPETENEYKKMINDLNALNITYHEMFDTASALEIIKNRKNLDKADGRPIALLIYPNPKTDWNTAFAKNSQIVELIRRGYKVVYFEVKKDTEFYEAVKAAGKKQKISLMVIAGHGEKGRTNFGAYYGEEFALDLSDEQEMKDLKLGEYMEEDSVIIMESCSTGAGREEDKNIANLVAGIFYKSEVFAPQRQGAPMDYYYESNRVIWVDYANGTYNTYNRSQRRQ